MAFAESLPGAELMAQASEPSVEEILASIKKVIARDNRDAQTAPLREKSAPAASVELSEDEILDLSEVDFADDDADDSEGYAAEAEPESPLITETARLSMRESLVALSVMAQPGAQPQIVRSGETSLEGMTRELLRPALAEWLDKNLPPLVESLVAAEIARIVGKKV